MTRGKTPITKNINVIDAAGNQYEATYPKRAKGLVKHGRARFIDEHTLCLACPPNTNLEDKSMNNNILHDDGIMESAFDAPEHLNSNGPRPGSKPAVPAKAELTIEWIVAKMDEIIRDNAHIVDSLKALKLMDTNGHNSKAEAISRVVAAREDTNKQSLRLLEKIYDGLKPTASNQDLIKHIDLVGLAESLESEHVVEIVKALANS